MSNSFLLSLLYMQHFYSIFAVCVSFVLLFRKCVCLAGSQSGWCL